MTYLTATDSNGVEVYLFQLEDNSVISVPKDRLNFKPLSLEELKKLEKDAECYKPEDVIDAVHSFHNRWWGKVSIKEVEE